MNFTNDGDRTLVFTAAAMAAGFGGVELTDANGLVHQSTTCTDERTPT